METQKKSDPSVIDRDPNSLYPFWRDMILPAVELCHKNGLAIYIFEGARTYERSDWLYAQGRTRPGNIVTNARGGFSAHNFGFAVDLVFDGSTRDGMQWTWDGNYAKAAKLIKGTNAKIEWAGDWVHFKETPHFQLKQPYQWHQLDAMYHAGGLPAVWKAFDKLFLKPQVQVQVNLKPETVATVEPAAPVAPVIPTAVPPAEAPKTGFLGWLGSLFR